MIENTAGNATIHAVPVRSVRLGSVRSAVHRHKPTALDSVSICKPIDNTAANADRPVKMALCVHLASVK